jgi:hypothetical protein
VGGVVTGLTDALGLTDSKAGAAEAGAAQDIMREQLRRMENVELPEIEKMRIALEAPELLEEYTPTLLEETELGEIALDPRMREAQFSALEEMRELGQTGLGPEDLAAARELSRQVGAQEQARQESILQQMAQRGVEDSGIAAAARLASSQAAANRQAAQADRLAMESAAARRGALAQQANLAGSLRGQEFGEAAQRAQAQDVINRFNVGLQSQAAMRNIGERQRIAEQGAALRNQQQMFNKQLQQQQFENQMRKTGAAGGIMSGMAQQQAQIGAGKAQAAAQQGAGLLGLGGTLGAAALMAPVASDRRLKEDIEQPKSEEIIGKLEGMLDELKAYRYDYKDPEMNGEGDHIGLMAQDLEQSELGSEFVEDTPEGKMVDYGKMAPVMAAGLADLNERVRDLEKK